jgi:hypothetical protein
MKQTCGMQMRAEHPLQPVLETCRMGTEDRDTRYGHTPGTGANAPKRDERKEHRPDWKPRQGGDQTRADEDRLNPPIAPEEREKLR